MPNKLGIVMIAIITAVFFTTTAFAEEPLIKIAVGEARTKKSEVAFPPVRYTAGEDPQGLLRQIRDLSIEDLAFSGLFEFIDPAAYIENMQTAGIKMGSFKFSDWTTIGAEFLLKGEGKVTKNEVQFEIYLYATHSGRQLMAKRYTAPSNAIRKAAHTLANDVMLTLTGRKGPFTSKIAFVSDKSGTKEIYIADYDGFNPIQITSRHSISTGPDWSPDGEKLAFSSITRNSKNIKNHSFYLYELATGKVTLLSNREGLNNGASFSPDGKTIALTMSFVGNPEIFFLDPETKLVQRITNNFGLDVDPSWSPDGKYLTFVSDRSGKSMIYKMLKDGSAVQRLTFAGEYNAAPSWSPAGNKIAFAGWIDGHFDIFIMNTDGSNIERLTKDMGNNEDPHFAPDGYFIIYSSNRMGKKNLYITNIDNTVHRRITTNFGNCEAPKWGPAE